MSQSIREYASLLAVWGAPIPKKDQLDGQTSAQLRNWMRAVQRREEYCYGQRNGDGYWECRAQWYQMRATSLEACARDLEKEETTPPSPNRLQRQQSQARHGPYFPAPNSRAVRAMPYPTPRSMGTGPLATCYTGEAWRTSPNSPPLSQPGPSSPMPKEKPSSPGYKALTELEEVVNLANLLPKKDISPPSSPSDEKFTFTEN